MTENKRFVCYFDNILKKWCVQDTDSLDMHYVADEPMGEEFAHLLNLYQQTLDRVEKENEHLKKELKIYRGVANCSNCKYQNYDWFEDGDEFEICEKGNNNQQIEYHICKEWEEF